MTVRIDRSRFRLRPCSLPCGVRGALGGMLLVAVVGLTACAPSEHASPLTTDYKPGDPEAEMTFWHELAEQPIVTNGDAMHALVELHQGADAHADYAARLAGLKDAGLLDAHFHAPANQAVRRGTVAQIVARHLEIDGGLTMRLVGAHPRYADRELVYLDIMKPGTPGQALSGIQFVGILARAENFEGRVP